MKQAHLPVFLFFRFKQCEIKGNRGNIGNSSPASKRVRVPFDFGITTAETRQMRRKQYYSRAELLARQAQLVRELAAGDKWAGPSLERVNESLAELDAEDSAKQRAKLDQWAMTEPDGQTLDARLARETVRALREALAQTGTVVDAANRLGISERQARRILRQYRARD
jgi:hypothetical protein